MTFPFPTFVPSTELTLHETLTRLGLTSGLQLCLDAGDKLSYPGSGQDFLNRVGGGLNFHLGNGAAANATDPTFNGTAGRKSRNEYFSFDGGDFFLRQTANPTWVDNLHKNNATATYIGWVYPGQAGVSQALFGTAGSTTGASPRGVTIFLSSDGNLRYVVGNGTGSWGANVGTGRPWSAGRWQMVAWSVSEGGGGSGSFAGNNNADGSYDIGTWNASVTSPSVSGATYSLEMASAGSASGTSGDLRLTSGSRLAMSAIWSTNLSQNDIRAIYAATRKRFKV